MSDVVKFPAKLRHVENRPANPFERSDKRKMQSIALASVTLLEWTDRTVDEVGYGFAIESLENTLISLRNRAPRLPR